MEKSILYVGLDVDDKSFHGCGLSAESGEVIRFKSRPTFGAVMKKLGQWENKGFTLRVCYEATYIGYTLCRALRGQGMACEVIAPSLTPEKPGERVKTDRIDCLKLAEYYAKDMLTPIHVPDEEDEQVRDLIRARSFLVTQRKRLKQNILSICRRHGVHYKEARGATATYWTRSHMRWLTAQVNAWTGARKKTVQILLDQLDQLNEGITEYERCIEQYADEDRYRRQKGALNCFRGLDTLSSMTLATELGDILRFAHPKRLTSYSGMDLREYSSGGKEKKYGITKMGNWRIRSTVVEACQRVTDAPRLSKRLKAARKDQDENVIAVADRCMARLHHKAKRMQQAGKHVNKIKVACARELLGFVWEALRLVA